LPIGIIFRQLLKISSSKFEEDIFNNGLNIIPLKKFTNNGNYS